MAIVTYPLNGITYNAEDAETYLSTRISGIYAADDCFDLSITADRTVTIGPGLAWVRNTRFAGKSICNREVLALAIPMADSSKPRTDRIVLRYLDETTLRPVTDTVEGFTAVIFQHEIDHLDGVLFIDRMQRGN